MVIGGCYVFVFKLIGGSYHIFPGAKKNKVGFPEAHFSMAFSSF